MKEKIIIFIIGLLVGSIISTGAFYIYSALTNSNENCDEKIQMNGGQPPEMPNSENGQPPEMPNSENGQPPEPPSENKKSTN